MNATTKHRWLTGVGVVGTTGISAGAFWLSFSALTDLAAASGIHPDQSWVWPLIVDGLIVVATIAAVALAGRDGVWFPWLLLVAAAAVSITGNALQATMTPTRVPTPMAATVSAIPPLVLLAVTHLTVLFGRHAATRKLNPQPIDDVHASGTEPGRTSVAPPPSVPFGVVRTSGDREPPSVPRQARRTPFEVPSSGCEMVDDPARTPGTRPADTHTANEATTVVVNHHHRPNQPITSPSGPPPTPADSAREFIVTYLRAHGGTALVGDIMDAGRRSGHTPGTLKTARRRCKPPVTTTSTPDGWVWSINGDSPEGDTPQTCPEDVPRPGDTVPVPLGGDSQGDT